MATKSKAKSPPKRESKERGLKKLVAGAKKIAGGLGRSAKAASKPGSSPAAKRAAAPTSAKRGAAPPPPKAKSKAKSAGKKTKPVAATKRAAAPKARTTKKGTITATKDTGRGKSKSPKKVAAEAVSEPKKPKKSSAKSKADSINMTPKESSVAPHAHVARSMPDYGAVRDILLAMRREALGDLRQEPRRTEEESRAGGDIYDQASDERDRELSLLMSERERAKLASIDDALSRIKDGSYGECESCGEMIPIGRLKVMPFAIFCVDCQSQAELDAKREAFYGEGINAFGGLDSESEAEG